MVDLSKFPFNPPSIAEYEARPPHATRIGGGPRYADGVVLKPDKAPLISVVTPCLNAADTIEETIRSVLIQRAPGDMEYIVVDGASTDGTIDILRRYENHFSLWISEPDGGISDGFNKGISLSASRYVMLAFADDLLGEGHLAAMIEALETSGADYAFCDLHYIEPDGSEFVIKGDPHYDRQLSVRMTNVNHPTIVARRTAYERYGLFSNSVRVAMDHDLFLRWHRCGARGVYVPGIMGTSKLGGNSYNHYIAGKFDVLRIARAHGAGPSAWFVFLWSVAKSIANRILKPVLPRGLRVWLSRQFRQGYKEFTSSQSCSDKKN